jgi:hypothetical protein
VTTEALQYPITIAPEATSLRRSAGPVAWVVLEIMVASSDDGLSSLSAAEIATVAGLHVDTVQHALRRLSESGVVSIDAVRVGGRFTGHTISVNCNVTPGVVSFSSDTEQTCTDIPCTVEATLVDDDASMSHVSSMSVASMFGSRTSRRDSTPIPSLFEV